MARYAQKTSVDPGRSRDEVERTLRRYGASQFATGWTEHHMVVSFVVNGRHIRFVIDVPDPTSSEFTRTETGRPRSTTAANTAYEQALRQRWRALALVIKAKLEAVEAGIAQFEDEFLAYVVLPDGRTVGEVVGPEVETALRSGVVPPLLAIGPGR